MNKLENTPQNFRKFAALYLYQEVLIYPFNNKQNGYRFILSTINNIDTSYCALELIPLSQISDEDAIGLAKIENAYDNALDRGKALVRMFDFLLLPPSIIGLLIDYLRSKGYALPWMGLSVDDLIGYGWIKLREVNHG